MSTVIEDALPILDEARGLLDEFGFNSYDVVMRLVEWSGARIGEGDPTKTDTTLTLDGSHRINVERLTGHDIMASGGLYSEGDWRVGPLTPAYPGGGRDASYFNPTSSQPFEIFYKLTGPGFESGQWFRKIDQKVDGNFGLFFTIRAENVTDP